MPAPGLTFREQDGGLHLALPASPYLGEQDQAAGRTAGCIPGTRRAKRPRTGGRPRGRRDSQVSVGGLKVDLTGSSTLAALHEVANVV
jgi:hypothetical protein